MLLHAPGHALPKDYYSTHINQVEARHEIPQGLLAAISKVESGRWHEGERRIVPWPWAIHAEGQGHFFASKADAVAAVKRLRAKGVTNIDVGLMQINLHYHADAFETLDHAFDPKHNVDYAARFLKDLKENHKSWTKAVAHYHSALPEHHVPYREKVLKMWREEKKYGLQPWSETENGMQTLTSWFRSPQGRLIHVKNGLNKGSSRLKLIPVKGKESVKGMRVRSLHTAPKKLGGNHRLRFFRPIKANGPSLH